MATADISTLQTNDPPVQMPTKLHELPSTETSTSPRRAMRHTKGLSLNFPIMVPSQSPIILDSPTLSPTPTESTRSSPRLRPFPTGLSGNTLAPDLAKNAANSNSGTSSSDCLTLIAAQERKVLELKEELSKAESELLGLKKQWATFEANKKREEVRPNRKLHTVIADATASSEQSSPIPKSDEEVEEERRRRRTLVERTNNIQSMGNDQESGKLARKGSKRVFEGKHTRALSLLSPVRATPETQRDAVLHLGSVDENTRPAEVSSVASPQDTSASAIKPHLSRMPTLDGFISGDNLSFGRTYRELATQAQRRSLPPGTADMLVKQGKQMVDGVRDGLWTFFEDIRQATVGDEGINAIEQRPPGTSRTAGQNGRPAKSGQRKTSGHSDKSSKSTQRQNATADPSFWTEFGLDTPTRSFIKAKPEQSRKVKAKQPDLKTSPLSETSVSTNRSDLVHNGSNTGHIQAKSSTDSSNPPDLLADNDEVEVEEEEEAWDTWSSPVSPKHRDVGGAKQNTPRQLLRSATELVQQWEDQQQDVLSKQEHTTDGVSGLGVAIE